MLYASLTALGIAAVATSAYAQSQSAVPPGSFIYSRDVPTREAQAKEPPSTAHYATLDQSGLISSGLGAALSPLADQEIGAMAAASNSPLLGAGPGGPEAAALSGLPNTIISNTNLLGAGQGAGEGGSATGALQAVNQAMSALKTALGGPR